MLTHLTNAESPSDVIDGLDREPTLSSQAVEVNFEHVHGVINGLDFFYFDCPCSDLLLGLKKHSFAMFIALSQNLVVLKYSCDIYTVKNIFF